ncbi:MAG TPA: AAA family ATPase [Pyrinomonadaceae bacterium]|nr:AAA family ATPase [Pyrinomonadaceae bacterium]
MPVHEIDLAILLRNLDDDAFLAEALLFPEVSRFGDDPEKLKRAIIKNAVRIIESEALPQVWTRLKPANFESFEINLTLNPPQQRLSWREPIELRLHVVRWNQGDAAHVALIPALGIEVLTTKLTDLQANPDQTSMLQRHARAELQRRGALANLLNLLLLDRTRGLTVVRAYSQAEIRSPKQVMASAGKKKEKKSTLEQTAVDLTTQQLSPAFEVDQVVENLAEALVGQSASSVLLVGKAGVGKTAVVHELVRHRARFGLGTTPFWSTSGARLVAGMTGFGMWQERCDSLWQEAEKTNAIVHFGNLMELVDTGKSEHNTQGLASFFRQRFARRQALAILECTPEQLSVVEREDPGTLKVLRQLMIEEPSLEAGRKILKRFAAEFPHGTTGSKNKRRQAIRTRRTSLITDPALELVDQLHRRFAGYSAYPSRPLRFLRGLLQHHATAQPESDQIGNSDVITAFAAETGLPLFLLDDQVIFDTDNTAKWFEERVIGQSAAVRLIVDLLATVKAGLTRPRRPIASLLFAGPTGVGKTEMAKSLARFFFGDENRMARFDMSEYADALAVTHLVGGATGNEGTLTARIREQPFSVVLFDEFEKAHHSFFDLLLQTLGDGRMTDGRGRVADFTNSIVVMTSNLGAAKFRRPRAGFDAATQGLSDSDRAAQKHFTRAVQDFLRPEIFNRIDHIVPFLPLDRKTVEQIAARELKLVERRDGLMRRGVVLRTAPQALEVLARRGYDAHYGARPLKRLIERELLLPLAVELNRRPAMTEGKRTTMIADVDVKAGHIAVALSAETRPAHEDSSLAARVDRLADLRRRIVRLGRSSAVIELQNTIWRLSEMERRIRKAARRAKLKAKIIQDRFAALNPAEAAVLALLPKYRQKMASLSELESRSANAEDEALIMFYSGEANTLPVDQTHAVREIETGLQELLRQLLDLKYAHPNRVTLAIYSENKDALFELARAYYKTAVGMQMQVAVSYYTANLPPELFDDRGKLKKQEDDAEPKVIDLLGRKVVRDITNKPVEFLAHKPEACNAIVFRLDGKSAYATWNGEHGLHVFVEGKTSNPVMVHTSDVEATEYRPPSFLDRRGAIQPANVGPCRRTYKRAEMYAEDHLVHSQREWHGNLPAVLSFFMDQQLQRAAERLIEE